MLEGLTNEIYKLICEKLTVNFTYDKEKKISEFYESIPHYRK